MINRSQLALELRAQREFNGWTQAELGARAGVSREYIVRLESGKLRSEIGSVFDVVRALGMELRLSEKPKRAPGPGEHPFDVMFRNLDGDSR